VKWNKWDRGGEVKMERWIAGDKRRSRMQDVGTNKDRKGNMLSS
jgi:hypothetical protein